MEDLSHCKARDDRRPHGYDKVDCRTLYHILSSVQLTIAAIEPVVGNSECRPRHPSRSRCRSPCEMSVRGYGIGSQYVTSA